MKPAVSVIVPIYNVEKYLSKCIESIINQTLTNIEIILVNDGSTDNSGFIADEYAKKDERIKVLHKKNAGQGSARNIGLDIAKGEYIGFIDSDDWIDLNMYNELYKNAIDYNSDICICNRKVFNETNKLINLIDVENKLYTEINQNIIDYLIKEFFYPSTVSACNKIYKKEIIDNNNIRFKSFKDVGSEDTLFNYEMLFKINTVKTINNISYNQLARNGSTMRSYNKGYFIRLNNLLNNISKISTDNLFNKKIISIMYIYFMGRYTKLILQYDKEGNLLESELNLVRNNKLFKYYTKNVIFMSNRIMKKMGYRISGIVVVKIKALLVFMEMNKIRSKIEILC